jgi:hypothetical protein
VVGDEGLRLLVQFLAKKGWRNIIHASLHKNKEITLYILASHSGREEMVDLADENIS